MRYYLIAGEASGDLHGAKLVAALREKDAAATVRCWGGDRMEAAGATLVKHYRDLAFMGFVEVIRHLPTIFKNLNFCKKDILDFQPDVLVLIDYPGFNLRIAKWAKQQGFKVVYYISPQVWAWKEGRVHQIKKYVDRMLVILPFEVDFYRKWNYDVQFVGHPLIETITEAKQNIEHQIETDQPVIALLPGSRRQEIALKLPLMMSVIPHFPGHQFVVAKAASIEAEYYRQLIGQQPVQIFDKGTYNLLAQSKAALVTSGTATLETALFGVPQIVCYKGNALSYYIAKRLIKVKYISLVNLIMDAPVVPELIQDELNETQLVKHLSQLINEGMVREEMLRRYALLWEKLGNLSASCTAAEATIELAKKRCLVLQ